jgi:hypothetical protein
MTLTATFELTPRNSRYFGSVNNWANLEVYGAYFKPHYGTGYLYSFESQHTQDQLYFSKYYAADPTLDYTIFSNRRIAPHIDLYYNLTALGEKKELALVFGFQADSEARLLIYSDAGLLGEEQLFPGDNQFLMEIETLDYFTLHFFHTLCDGSYYGGDWFFKGISGYVV